MFIHSIKNQDHERAEQVSSQKKEGRSGNGMISVCVMKDTCYFYSCVKPVMVKCLSNWPYLVGIS